MKYETGSALKNFSLRRPEHEGCEAKVSLLPKGIITTEFFGRQGNKLT